MAQNQGIQAAPFTKTYCPPTHYSRTSCQQQHEMKPMNCASPAHPWTYWTSSGRELLIPQLNKIHDHLWKAGRPMSARNLGHQLVLSREIVLTEDINLHLIWKPKKMYLKPLPKYLLVPETWSNQLVAQRQDSSEILARRQELNACARGLLFSYCALIAYESDFALAQKLSLISEDFKWLAWREYCYGELRLGRLNGICRFQQGRLLRGYSTVGSASVYSELLSENFALLATILGYIVIVLTAMQVGLATTHLNANSSFQNASYGFTVFSIIAPLAAVAFVLGVVFFMFIGNWWKTLRYEEDRGQVMGVHLRKGTITPNDQQGP